MTDTPENPESTPAEPNAAAAKAQPPVPLQQGHYAATPPDVQPTPAQPAPPQPTAQHPAEPQYSTATSAGTAQFGAPTQPALSTGAPTPPPPAGPAASTTPGGSAFRRTSPVVAVALLAVGALVGGVSGAGVSLWANNNNQSSSTAPAVSPASVTINDADDATAITAVALNASASVVTISATSADGGGTGSGVVLSEDGYVVTNTHVVTLDGASGDAAISVQTNDGRLYSATVVGTDPISDLAVIKLDDASGLKAATFADSSKLNVGDTAIAIGAPLGLSGTVTNGIVSALNRSITIASSAVPEETVEEDQTPTPDTQNPFDFWQFDLPGQEGTQAPSASTSTISLAVIQTDAAINPGNSGGALLDSAGEVIGINVAIATAGGTSTAAGSIGVGFSIPSNLAKRVADEIIENGVATHGLLGAGIRDVTDDADAKNVTTVGASVKEVTAGGPAEAAGIQVGDVITGFNGLPITGATDLTAQVRALAAGAETDVTVVRAGKTLTMDVTLGAL